MQYKITYIPTKKSGFNHRQLYLIANGIINIVNADNADLMLNRAFRKDIITWRGFKNPIKCIRPNYADFVKPWEVITQTDYFNKVTEKPAYINISFDSFKMSIEKTPYAVRKVLKKLGIEIEEIKTD